MTNTDQIKLKDLEKSLEFHTQMENKGMMGILVDRIKKLINQN